MFLRAGSRVKPCVVRFAVSRLDCSPGKEPPVRGTGVGGIAGNPAPVALHAKKSSGAGASLVEISQPTVEDLIPNPPVFQNMKPVPRTSAIAMRMDTGVKYGSRRLINVSRVKPKLGVKIMSRMI